MEEIFLTFLFFSTIICHISIAITERTILYIVFSKYVCLVSPLMTVYFVETLGYQERLRTSSESEREREHTEHTSFSCMALELSESGSFVLSETVY